MYARELAQALAEIVEIMAAYAAAYTAALQERTDQIAQACRGPRRDGAMIADDCAGILAEIQREIEPSGARRAYDCGRQVAEVESEIERQRVQIHIGKANSKTR